jgi:hypothetical protein
MQSIREPDRVVARDSAEQDEIRTPTHDIAGFPAAPSRMRRERIPPAALTRALPRSIARWPSAEGAITTAARTHVGDLPRATPESNTGAIERHTTRSAPNPRPTEKSATRATLETTKTRDDVATGLRFGTSRG